MSMNQTAIMSFLGKPRNRVMLDTSYTNAFGRTPGTRCCGTIPR